MNNNIESDKIIENIPIFLDLNKVKEDSLYFLTDDIKFLNNTGYELKGKKIEYTSGEQYKHLFLYKIIKQYDLNQLFQYGNCENYNYSHKKYNTITITDETNDEDISNLIEMIYKYLSNVTSKVCFIVEMQCYNNIYHDTLLVYEPFNKLLEYFDPNARSRYFNSSKFDKIIDSLKEKIPFLQYINSKKLYGYENKSDREALLKSFNRLSSHVTRNNEGWCQMWTIFIFELVFRYPFLTTSEIVKNVIGIYKGIHVKNVMLYFKNIIRSYLYISNYDINKILEEYDLHISIEDMAFYNTVYVKNDIKISQIIEDELSSRLLKY